MVIEAECSASFVYARRMPIVEERLRALGLTLPPPAIPPPGVALPFRAVRIVGARAIVSGHGPQAPDGALSRGLSARWGAR